MTWETVAAEFGWASDYSDDRVISMRSTDSITSVQRMAHEILKLRSQNDSQYKSLMSYITESREREQAKIEADDLRPVYGELAEPKNE